MKTSGKPKWMPAFVNMNTDSKSRSTSNDMRIEHFGPSSSKTPATISECSSSSQKVSVKSSSGNTSGKLDSNSTPPSLEMSSKGVNANRNIQQRLMNTIGKQHSGGDSSIQKMYKTHNESFLGLESSQAVENVEKEVDPRLGI